MILNPNKTSDLVVNRSRTVNPPHGDLILSGVSIWNSNLHILVVKFDSRLIYEDHVRGIVSRVSQELVFWGWWRVSLWTPLCCFVTTMHLFSISMRYCSPVCGSADECHRQLLERQVYSVARLSHDQTFLSLCHLPHVAALCMLYSK